MRWQHVASALFLVAPMSLFVAACEVDVGGGGGVACFVAGNLCDFDSDCCSDFCDQGVCTPVAGACLADDEVCDFDDECCGGFCAGDGYCGVPACIPTDEACSFDDECCVGYCDVDGYCGAALTCTADDFPCSTHHECCAGYCAGDGYCN